MGVPVNPEHPETPLTPAQAGSPARATLPDRCSRSAPFRRINNQNPGRHPRRRGVAPILGPLLALAFLPTGATARAQPLPDALEVMRCYQAIEAGIRASGEANEPIADPPGATGASVTLRLGGRIIGRGASLEDAGSNARRAFDEAWNEASASLIIEGGDEAEDRRHALGARITIDLEVSGSLRPLLGATFEAAGMGLSPGLEGVAIREGERIAGVFPAMQLIAGLSPDRALRVAAGKLGLPPSDLDTIRRGHDVTLYSFRVQHLAQPRPGQAPRFLQRGGSYVPLSDVTGANLRATADAIAAHLLTRAWSGPEPYGMRGDYRPTTGAYDPLIAEPFPQALVAFSLVRCARTPGIDLDTAARSFRFAGAILRDLTSVAAEESDPSTDPIASAMWLLAWAELRELDPGAAQDEALADFSALAMASVRGAMDGAQSWSAMAPGAKALVAYALARAARTGVDPDTGERARLIVGELLSGSTIPQLASLMPWIVWAELEISPPDRIPAEPVLRDFRAMTWQFQVEEPPAESPDADLSGGIVFTRAGARFPTWQTLRPLAAIASMLGSPVLTDDRELALEVARARRSLRFLMQLTLREAELFMVQSERRAFGGVRLALWDQTQGLEANATALLAVCEVLRSVASRSENPDADARP